MTFTYIQWQQLRYVSSRSGRWQRNEGIFFESRMSKLKCKGSSEEKMGEPTGRWEVRGRPAVSSTCIYQKSPENMIPSGTTLEVRSSESGASQVSTASPNHWIES